MGDNLLYGIIMLGICYSIVNAQIKLLVLQRRLLLGINVSRPRYAMEKIVAVLLQGIGDYVINESCYNYDGHYFVYKLIDPLPGNDAM